MYVHMHVFPAHSAENFYFLKCILTSRLDVGVVGIVEVCNFMNVRCATISIIIDLHIIHTNIASKLIMMCATLPFAGKL